MCNVQISCESGKLFIAVNNGKKIRVYCETSPNYLFIDNIAIEAAAQLAQVQNEQLLKVFCKCIKRLPTMQNKEIVPFKDLYVTSLIH